LSPAPLPQCSSLIKRFLCCGLGPALYGSCDPYAVLELQGTRRLRTSVMGGETSPHWDERFEVLVADEVQKLRIVVKVQRGGRGLPWAGPSGRAAAGRQARGRQAQRAGAGAWACGARVHPCAVPQAPPASALAPFPRPQDADVVGAEFLGHAFVDPQVLLDGRRHAFALDLMDQQVGGGG
jgi:hypothetical protein